MNDTPARNHPSPAALTRSRGDAAVSRAGVPASRVGTHVAVAGGLVRTGLRETAEAGAEVIQVFAGNPRGWAPTTGDRRTDDAFRAACGDLDIPVFVHAPYLINIGSPSAEVREKSVVALEHTMRRAASLGARGVVLHAGSSVSDDRRGAALAGLHDLVTRLLDRVPPEVGLLIEPTAGGGAALASTVDSTIEYLAALDDDRVAVCLDTCHLHAAGEEVADPVAFQRALERLVAGIGPHRIGLVHVNDSRDPMGSRRDRHESLGKGTIGTDGLAALFSTPVLRGVPLLVETPTHPEDVRLLKQLREYGTAPTAEGRGPTHRARGTAPRVGAVPVPRLDPDQPPTTG